MTEVVVVGGGPAGAMAALCLARAGVPVRVFEREGFPRHKLCGDTLNPGALAVLGRHVDLEPLLSRSHPLDGMVLTGPGGTRVVGRYGAGLSGRAVTRRDFDAWLLAEAASRGARIEESARVARTVRDAGIVRGVEVAGRGGAVRAHPAAMVIAADGRRSALARGLGLARHPSCRRWAIGAYFSDVEPLPSFGEMHVRVDRYVGVAGVPGGLTRACLVVPRQPGPGAMPLSADMFLDRLRADPILAPRFARARMVDAPTVLGPMAVDVAAAGVPGLLLAGDAAGFIDPITGDGVRFALEGGCLAAEVALDVLAGRLDVATAHLDLDLRRRRAFAAKWRFNRTLRALVATPAGVRVASTAARLAPAPFERLIRYAGDCGLADQS